MSLPKDLEHLEAGDVVVNRDGDDRTVIDVLPHSVLLSQENKPDEAYAWYTPAELKQDGYTLKNTPTPEVTELTLDEITEKLGLPVGTLRVKVDENS